MSNILETLEKIKKGYGDLQSDWHDAMVARHIEQIDRFGFKFHFSELLRSEANPPPFSTSDKLEQVKHEIERRVTSRVFALMVKELNNASKI